MLTGKCYFGYEGRGHFLWGGDIWDETWITRSNESCKDTGRWYSSQRQWPRKAFEDMMSLAHSRTFRKARVVGVWYTRESAGFWVSLLCSVSRNIWERWWIEEGHEFFDTPPAEVGDLCLLLFDLGPVTVWPIEFREGDIVPVFTHRPEEIGIFYFLSVETFTLGTHSPCCKDAPRHIERPCVGHRWASSQSLCHQPTLRAQPHSASPLSLHMTPGLAFVWPQPHEGPPPNETALVEPGSPIELWERFLSYWARYPLGLFNLEIHLLELWEMFFCYFFLPLFDSMSAFPVNQMWDLIDQLSKPL